MAHQYLNNGDEKEARSGPSQSANEPERADALHDDAAQETAPRAEETTDTRVAAHRPRQNKNDDTAEPQAEGKRNHANNGVVAPENNDMQALEALGFTRDEAARLIEVSLRINGATLKRLQFAKWLVDQGLLDEFTVRD